LTQGDNLVQNDWQVQLDGEMALIRKVKSGQVTSITLCRASGIRIGNIEVKLKGHPELVEIQIDSGMARVVAGDKENVIDIRIEGKKLHDA
jgi:predicted amino acid racemase